MLSSNNRRQLLNGAPVAPVAPAKPATLAVLALIAVTMIGRLLLAGTIGLGIDESYAAAVALPFSASYFDHPPLVFWLAGAMESGGHRNSGLLLRLPFILLFAGTTWMMFRVTERSFGSRAGVYAALLLNISPVMSVSSGGWVLPDGPLLFAIAATALSLSHLLLDEPAAVNRWWVALGCSVGVALLSKYHAVFLVAGALLFAVSSARGRSWFRTPRPYVAIAIAAVMGLPVLIWNAQHDWASLRFQTGRAALHAGNPLVALLQNVGGQAGYLLPWIWLPLVCVLVANARRGPTDTMRWLLVCLGAGPVLFFTMIALGGRAGLPHWPAPGYLALFPLLGDMLSRGEQRGRIRLVRRYLAFSTIMFVGLMAFVATQTATGWFSRAEPQLFLRGDPSLDAVDWSGVRDSLRARGLLDSSSVTVARNWIEAGKLAYAIGPGARVVCLDDDARQFQFLSPHSALARAPGMHVLVTRLRPGSRNLPPGFVPVGTIPVYRGGRPEINLLVATRQWISERTSTPSRPTIDSPPAP